MEESVLDQVCVLVPAVTLETGAKMLFVKYLAKMEVGASHLIVVLACTDMLLQAACPYVIHLATMTEFVSLHLNVNVPKVIVEHHVKLLCVKRDAKMVDVACHRKNAFVPLGIQDMSVRPPSVRHLVKMEVSASSLTLVFANLGLVVFPARNLFAILRALMVARALALINAVAHRTILEMSVKQPCARKDA